MIKILIVDDEKIERNGIRFLLKQMGVHAELFEAANGLKALELLEEQRVDLLLTDIKMPFMDGMALIQNVAPIRDIEQEEWYQKGGFGQNIRWEADAEKKKVFLFRTMPILEQSGSRGILYLEVSYKELFSGFDEIFHNNYGLCVYDEQNHRTPSAVKNFFHCIFFARQGKLFPETIKRGD